MEVAGWDPLVETQQLFNDIGALLQTPLNDYARLRLGLLLYSHLTEVDAVYEVIANMVVDNPGWYVIDYSRLDHRSDEIRFATDFGVQLYRRKQRKPSAMHLFVDEADMFVPQKLPKKAKEMLDAYDAIVRRGGVYGLGTTLISQRPALVNKDVTTQCETLIALQTSAPEDQDPILDWVSRNGTREQLEEIKKTLASLRVGQAWIFSPNSDAFKLIKIRTRETFNSSATPKPGAKPVEPKIFAAIDLEKLGEEVAATVERSRREDPEYLRGQIAQLRRELTEKQASTPKTETMIETKVERVEVPALPQEQFDAIMKSLADLRAYAKDIRSVADAIEAYPLGLDAMMDQLNQAVQKWSTPGTHFSGVDFGSGKDRTVRAVVKVSPAREIVHVDSGDLPEGENRILTRIAQYAEGVTAKQLTVLTGYKRSTRNTYLQRLSQKGAVEKRGDRIYITDVGRQLVNFMLLPTGEDLRAYWLSELPEGERAILKILIDVYPGNIDRDEIDRLTGYKRSTRNTYIQRMLAKEVVYAVSPGQIRASDHLFE